MLIIEAVDEEHGIKINGKRISTIRYADDTAVVAPTQDILQRMMDKSVWHAKTTNEIKCEENKGDDLEEGQ